MYIRSGMDEALATEHRVKVSYIASCDRPDKQDTAALVSRDPGKDPASPPPNKQQRGGSAATRPPKGSGKAVEHHEGTLAWRAALKLRRPWLRLRPSSKTLLADIAS